MDAAKIKQQSAADLEPGRLLRPVRAASPRRRGCSPTPAPSPPARRCSTTPPATATSRSSAPRRAPASWPPTSRPGMVAAGRERSEAEGVDIEWVEADAEDLPFEDARFDCVGSVFGAMIAPRPRVAAEEMFRVVKPGGTVGMTAWTEQRRELRDVLGGPPLRAAPEPGEESPPGIEEWARRGRRCASASTGSPRASRSPSTRCRGRATRPRSSWPRWSATRADRRSRRREHAAGPLRPDARGAGRGGARLGRRRRPVLGRGHYVAIVARRPG